jgi:hypothetical protein
MTPREVDGLETCEGATIGVHVSARRVTRSYSDPSLGRRFELALGFPLSGGVAILKV